MGKIMIIKKQKQKKTKMFLFKNTIMNGIVINNFNLCDKNNQRAMNLQNVTQQ